MIPDSLSRQFLCQLQRVQKWLIFVKVEKTKLKTSYFHKNWGITVLFILVKIKPSEIDTGGVADQTSIMGNLISNIFSVSNTKDVNK